MQRCIYLEALLTTMLLPQQQSLYTIIYTATQPIHAATLRTINYQPWMLLYLYNHASAATPTTKCLPLQLHTATLQPCCYPNNQVFTLTTTYCYPTKSLPLQLHTATLQPCCYPNNLVPTLTTTYCYPATMLLPQQPSPYPYNYILLPCNHAVTPTTKSIPLQLHTATLQPCCYPNNLVPTLTTTYCYPTTMLLPQQPCR